MCATNQYTISLCGGAFFNSTLSITAANGNALTPPVFDDDGCGTVGGLSTITYTPTVSGTHRIRIRTPNTLTGNTTLNNATITGLASTTGMVIGNPISGPGIPLGATIASIVNATTITISPNATATASGVTLTFPCGVNNGLCGTLVISIAPIPPPPSNDSPCNAISLNPVTTSCNLTSGTGSYATTTTVPGTTVSCANVVGYDVWYTATVPASGNLAVQLNHVSATDMAMAVYSLSGACPGGTWTLEACNADLAAPTILEPYVAFSLPALANQTVYIRVYPQGGNGTNGTFQICAYETVPPPGDQPCSPIALPVTSPCSATPFTTENATAVAGMTLSPANPTCGTPVTGGDVWFSFVATAAAHVINTLPGSLTDMAMAVYRVTAGSNCSGTLTQMTCDDNSGVGGTMPLITQGGLTIGTTYYVRLWTETAQFGTASICVTTITAPPNDDPCGAIPLPVNSGCLFTGYSSANATNSGTVPPNTASVPNPTTPCAGTAPNDVWYTAVVPSNGVLQFDTDEGQMTNAAMTVYTVNPGTSCAGGNLALTQVGSDCNSSLNGNMPALTVSGLTPGATVYVRVWLQTAATGTFLMCAQSTVPPAGNCNYVLRMEDSGGDGWNGSFVTVCIDPPGAPPPVCTNYTVAGAYANITIGANVGDVITVSYTAVGGFQNQIGYELVTPTGGVIFASNTPPASPGTFPLVVDALCNVPPAPPEDCVGAITLCNSQAFSFPPINDGAVDDLNSTNHGCLLGDESIGVWLRFRAQITGDLAFTIQVPNGTDYDFAVWGPYNGLVDCPPDDQPLRCSWSGATGNTGLNFVAADLTEGAGGDKWVRYIDANAGESFLLYVDNWSQNTTAFTLTWQNIPSNILDCTLPVELLSFEAVPKPRQVDLEWVTGSEEGSSYFKVERSADGENFLPLGQVPAAGFSVSPKEYHFVDVAPAGGMNYYRLDMVDADGEREFSKTVTATYRMSSLVMDLYPNPAGSSIFAAFEMPGEGTVRWRVMDMSGRIIGTAPANVAPGMNQMEVPLTNVEAGAYLLELIDASGVTMGNARFVRQ